MPAVEIGGRIGIAGLAESLVIVASTLPPPERSRDPTAPGPNRAVVGSGLIEAQDSR